MYHPIELFRFAVSEFRRGLEGLTDDEARVRLPKADGSQMNAISWTVGHIAGHWLFVDAIATRRRRPSGLRRFGTDGDPTPPPLEEVRGLLDDAEARSDSWIAAAGSALLNTTHDIEIDPGENLGTRVMRAVLHTWFHNGEINAMRQQLGHPEIFFLGDITEFLEWRPGGDMVHGYPPVDMARFTFSEFERGFAGLTEEEATTRLEKRDGTQMNAPTWTVKHISVPWLFVSMLATGAQMPDGMGSYFGPGADPTPPSVEDAFALLAQAKSTTEAWLPQATDEMLSQKRAPGRNAQENTGTILLRAMLHTWFHTGEINATRQLLGHPEIQFIGQLQGELEWRGWA